MASTLLHAPWDLKALLASVLLRRASFGLTNQVLALFLESVGISKTRIGTFMTLTLVGDTVISLFLTWFSDIIGRRLVMIVGCVLMLASGLVFAHFSNYWILLLAAIMGVISTSGDETGPFKSVEEACLSQLTLPAQRAHIFAIYGLLGTFGSAIGAYTCGFLVDYWRGEMQWSIDECYRAIFVGYAAIALVKLLLTLTLTKKCELAHILHQEQPKTEDPPIAADILAVTESMDDTSVTEETHLLSEEVADEVAEASAPELLPSSFGISAQSRSHLSRLLVVFMLDSFGYGFMPPAWIVYYFRTVFGASPTALGTLFFFTNSIDSLSSIVSAFTFYFLGPVKAILAAQLPSAVFFFCVPLFHTFRWAALSYFLFCACGTMDVVPRQILLTTIIDKQDLVKVLGIVNIAKTFARCVGPLFTGTLADKGLLYIAFFVNGVCLVVADTILGFSFAHKDAEILQQHRTE